MSTGYEKPDLVKHRVVKIKNPKTFAKMSGDIRGFGILDRTARAIYGKPITECLGKDQTIPMHGHAGVTYIIHMPPDGVMCMRHTCLQRPFGHYMLNILAQCRRHNITVVIVNM